MKSIKEKSVEYGKDWYQRKGFFSDMCHGCYAHVLSSYEAGANYVLEQIESLTKYNRWSAQDLYDLIEQLKK